MAILIDIETPKNCKECPFSDIVVVGHIYREQYICNFSGKHQSVRMQDRPDWCPLREVVRCVDCIYSEESYVSGCVYCEWNDMSCVEEGYCHRGERRGE